VNEAGGRRGAGAADQPMVGLRERKRARTRAAIQQHAVRLFRERGYAATTVEQIAEAAEVSPSTFFRYFPTKEDVVLWDDSDARIVAAFRAQAPELSPLQALRGALRAVFGDVAGPGSEHDREILALMRSVPELRARMLDEFARTIQVIAQALAERVGRPADDLAVRTFAGAVIGVSMAALLAAADDPSADYIALMDAGLALLEAGLPL
jgi:AcrR family transcriptional regulator